MCNSLPGVCVLCAQCYIHNFLFVASSRIQCHLFSHFFFFFFFSCFVLFPLLISFNISTISLTGALFVIPCHGRNHSGKKRMFKNKWLVGESVWCSHGLPHFISHLSLFIWFCWWHVPMYFSQECNKWVVYQCIANVARVKCVCVCARILEREKEILCV